MIDATRGLWHAASRDFAAGRFDAACTALQSIVAKDPTDAAAWLALAQVDLRTGRARQADGHALSALRQNVADADLLCAVNDVLLTTGSANAARDGIERVVALGAPSASLQRRIAVQYQNLGEHDAALAWLDRARASGLDDPATRFQLAIQLTFHGRFQEAESLLESCAAVEPPFGRAMAQLAQLRRQSPGHNHVPLLRQQLQKVARGSEDHAALEFACYKEFEDLGRHEDAWRSLATANATMHALLRHDADAEQRTFDALASKAAALPMPGGNGSHDGPTPIFIVGLPRSGTTLLDRMLGNHSEIRSAGELGTFWRGLQWAADRFTGPMLDERMVAALSRVDWAELGDRYLSNTAWRARGRRFIVDKMPRNWLLAPLIHCALPQARILHMVRAPMAVAFSNYRSYFGADYPYSYDLDCMVRHYRQYTKTMAHWHRIMPGVILDVAYEDLVAKPDATLRRVFAFCGLPWEPGCAALAGNAAPVATLSATQVRGGVQADTARRWHPYASHLAGLEAALLAADTEGSA